MTKKEDSNLPSVEIGKRSISLNTLLWLALSQKSRKGLAKRTIVIEKSSKPDQEANSAYSIFYDIYVSSKKAGYMDLHYQDGKFSSLIAHLRVEGKKYL